MTATRSLLRDLRIQGVRLATRGDRIHVEADRIEARLNQAATFTGQVELRHGKHLFADTFNYNQAENHIDAQGSIHLRREDGSAVLTPRLRYDIDPGLGAGEDAQFDLPDGQGRGRADNIRFEAKDVLKFDSVRYTTCPPKRNDWFLNASRLTLDKSTETGTATAQLLLAAKLKNTQHPQALAQSTKTALYFTNPFCLQLQLSKDAHDEQVTSVAPVTAKISSLLSDQLASFKKPLEADAKLDIEAKQEKLYTTDYFASQGIKIDLDAIPQDKLVSQMRKFTDWLKQMKRADTNIDLGVSSKQEKDVIQSAESSKEQREVVTESMAEVLGKQGQTDKAIQL